MSAARYGRMAVVLRLLDHGANINVVDWSDQSALANAAIGGQHELVDSLLSRGAQRSIVDAIALKDIELIAVMLDKELRCGRDVDQIPGGSSRPAMVAAGYGDMAIVRLLLDRGAALFDKRHDSHSLLAEAAIHGRVDIVKLLIERGADLHDVGLDGWTPLAWAVYCDQDEAAEMLRLAGAVR